MISFLVAMDENRVIGLNNDMPWHLPADLAYFKKMTTGHTIVMGRKTYESIGRALPNRKNVILTRDQKFTAENCIVIHSIDEALAIMDNNDEEYFVIGGTEIFQQFFPYADRLYITQINEKFEGDTYFPPFDSKEWKVVSREQGIKNEKNPYDYEFLIYEKI